jgi:hypothetical protein
MARAQQHSREAGFAMLFVFLLAACVAIALYNEMPRVIFEGQRQREQLLIDRGEQYQRAIRVFYRRYRRYPADLEALESTDNRRFLRRRYRDPMTNEDQWRLIHGLPNGVFTDSLVHKAPGQSSKDDSSTASVEGETAQPLWALRRPSDGTLPSADALPMETSSLPQSTTEMVETPVTPPAPTQAEAEAQALAAANAGAAGTEGTPTGDQNLAPFQPQVTTGVPVGTVQATVSLPFTPGQPSTAASTSSSASGEAQAGANAALRLIQDLLTRPNPRGLAAIQATATPTAGPPGIAGVASKLEMEGIMVYNDRSKYNEWEFIYDPRTEVTTVAPGTTGTSTGTGTTTTPRTGSSNTTIER